MADNAEEVPSETPENSTDTNENSEEVPSQDTEEAPAENTEEATPKETEDAPADDTASAVETSPENNEDATPETTEEAPEEKSEETPAVESETSQEVPTENVESNSDNTPENVEETPETESAEKPADKPKPVVNVDMSQEITVYHSSISCSQEVKKRQQTVEFILTSKKYNVKFVDLASIGESAKTEMREIADDPKCLPPQIAKGKEYCGNFVGFMEAVEDGQLLQFLKLTT